MFLGIDKFKNTIFTYLFFWGINDKSIYVLWVLINVNNIILNNL